jgi:altronate dehydratase large subunit
MGDEGFRGFRRSDGRAGVRNHVVILPGGFIGEQVARMVPGVLTLRTADKGYGHTALDRETIFRVLTGLGRNPNVYAIVLVDTLDWGYEELATERVRAAIAEVGTRVAVVNPDKAHGGTFVALEEAVAAARHFLWEASRLKRERCGLGDLALGVKCGNSDVTSGMAGNPVVGYIYDRVVVAGGRAFFGETTEILGAEEDLLVRAARPEVAAQIRSVATLARERGKATGQQWTDANLIPANRAGGIETPSQKSHGAIKKSGTTPIQGVLPYGGEPTGAGLYFVDNWMGSLSIFLGYCAAGATINIYQLGSAWTDLLDSCSSLCSPLVWTTANRRTFDYASNALDFCSAALLDGTSSLEEVGERFLETILEVASGGLSRGETLSSSEPLQIYMHDPVF